MKLAIKQSVLERTTCDALKYNRKSQRDPDQVVSVDISKMDHADLNDLLAAATADKEAALAKSLQAIIDVDRDTDWKVPNYNAFASMLKAYLVKHSVQGWVFHRSNDGCITPWAVRRITNNIPDSRARSSERPYTTLECTAMGFDENEKRPENAYVSKTFVFTGADCSRRSIATILAAQNLQIDTVDLIAEYETADKTFCDILDDGFAKQFRITGPVSKYPGYSREDPNMPIGHRVICDLDEAYAQRISVSSDVESEVFGGVGDTGMIPLPRIHIVPVFDVQIHSYFTVNAANMKPYVYNPGLRDKLILPETHRELLDILTTDLDVFVDDIVEGKSAGNIILAKGHSGLGKTLTAEVYAELIEKPLYSVQAGVLGTTASKIEEKLTAVFNQAERWDCVLLIDEADVFIMRRGDDLERNAVVAEFLRATERFSGLMFMTTNLPDDIDDAMLSRCAAIIHYTSPDEDIARALWVSIAKSFDIEFDDAMVNALLKMLPGASGRDIRKLLRLSLRVATHRGVPLSVDIVRQASMFRGVTVKAAA